MAPFPRKSETPDCKKSGVSCKILVVKQKILQGNYSSSFPYYQVTLPITNEHLIAEDEPVRLLDACVEDMKLSALYRTYERIPRNTATPRQLLKIVLYGYMNGIRSTRDLEKACHKNIDYMFLLGGAKVPDHTTIARFITLHLSPCIKEVFRHRSDGIPDAGLPVCAAAPGHHPDQQIPTSRGRLLHAGSEGAGGGETGCAGTASGLQPQCRAEIPRRFLIRPTRYVKRSCCIRIMRFYSSVATLFSWSKRQ